MMGNWRLVPCRTITLNLPKKSQNQSQSQSQKGISGNKQSAQARGHARGQSALSARESGVRVQPQTEDSDSSGDRSSLALAAFLRPSHPPPLRACCESASVDIDLAAMTPGFGVRDNFPAMMALRRRSVSEPLAILTWLAESARRRSSTCSPLSNGACENQQGTGLLASAASVR